jgi:hypothetical protein
MLLPPGVGEQEKYRVLARLATSGADPGRSHNRRSSERDARRVARKRVDRFGHTSAVLPAAAQEAVDDLLGRLDRAVPGRVDGFYVVGSACLGAFRVGRSDLDFVAVVAGELGRGELARVRAVHMGRWGSALVRDVAVRRRWPLVCNGIYLRSGDLSRSPLEVTPLAGHIAGRFKVDERDGLDVNPVTWHTLAGHGIAVRGPQRDRLQIHLDDAQLRSWTLGNLNSYWRRWTRRAQRNGVAIQRALPRRFAAWGVLGAPRSTTRSPPVRLQASQLLGITRWRPSTLGGMR